MVCSDKDKNNKKKRRQVHAKISWKINEDVLEVSQVVREISLFVSWDLIIKLRNGSFDDENDIKFPESPYKIKYLYMNMKI